MQSLLGCSRSHIIVDSTCMCSVKDWILPILQVGDGVLGIRAHIVGQHNQAQEVHVHCTGLHLLLSHPGKVQAHCIGDDPHGHCQQAEALAAVVIHHLCTTA